MITEAVYLRVTHEDEEFRKQAEAEAKRDEFKKESVDKLAQFRGGI